MEVARYLCNYNYQGLETRVASIRGEVYYRRCRRSGACCITIASATASEKDKELYKAVAGGSVKTRIVRIDRFTLLLASIKDQW